MFKKLILLAMLVIGPLYVEAKLPELTPPLVKEKLNEIMASHAKYHQLNPLLVKRALALYLEELDPNKTYFIADDIDRWQNPSDELLGEIISGFNKNDFQAFIDMHGQLVKAIDRRHGLETKVQAESLPKNVKPEEFKDMQWAANEDALLERLKRIKSLQLESASKLSDEVKEKSLQRIAKRQAIYEEEMLTTDPVQLQERILTFVLKAFSSAFDAHTAYFTPDEASQFMINVQQRLFGIGAQLRDDINGFTVVKIIEGGPAAEGKELKVKDRIIAVNGEPVVGMDIVDAVELIRGPENTPVMLTVIRESSSPSGEAVEEKHNIEIKRGEVVLKETRYESNFIPFGDGGIAYLKLYSFYQDQDSSSGSDLEKALKDLKQRHDVRGVILDLRYNSGGMLTQAVSVAGLFIGKGVVVSIKDEKGEVQHLRHLESQTAWDGPLIVLENRASASASEIVAGTLQDYGRAIIVGDDHTYGKGTFQTFTLNTAKNIQVNPLGEYKVTRGLYYTVSGRTPQVTGVQADITVPGLLSEIDIGEKFAKNPLEPDSIAPEFDDDLSDVPHSQRDKIRLLYKFDLQPKLTLYKRHLPTLAKNSGDRIKNDKNYQSFLKELKKDDKQSQKETETDDEPSGPVDLQLYEAYNIMRDLLFLMHQS